MSDIKEKLLLAETAPEEAAQNIKSASILDIEPAAFKQFKEELTPQLRELETPTSTDESVNEYVSQSEEHAALAKSSVPFLDYVGNQIKYTGHLVTDSATLDDRAGELANKRMSEPDKWSRDDEMELHDLMLQREQFAKRNYGIDGTVEQIPAMVARAIRDMSADVVIGAESPMKPEYRFLTTGIPLVGPLAAAATGYVEQIFKRIRGASYVELSTLTNDKGEPLNLDHETKTNLSNGVAVLSSAFEMVGLKGIGKAASPLVGRAARKLIGPVQMKEVLNNPANAALRQGMVQLGKAMGTEGLTETAQEQIMILAERIGETYDGTDVSILDGINDSIASFIDDLPRLATAGTVGALTGGVVAAPGTAIRTRKMRGMFENVREDVKSKILFEETKSQVVLSPEKAELERIRQEMEAESDKQIAEALGDVQPIFHSAKILETREAMVNMNKVIDKMPMAQLSKPETRNFLNIAWEKNGVKKFWISPSGWMQTLDPDKQMKVRQSVDPSGLLLDNMNVPMSISPADVQIIAQEIPEILNEIQLLPEGPTATSAENLIKKMEQAKETRDQIFADVGDGKVDSEASATLLQALNQDVGKAAEQVSPFEEMTDFGDAGDFMTPVTIAERNYVKEPLLTDVVKKMIPGSVVENIETVQTESRERQVEAIREAAELRMLKLQELEVELRLEEARRIEQDNLAFNPEIHLVEKFNLHRIGVKGKRYSIYAVDPDTLTEEQRSRYILDPQLKKHKFFVKGAGSLEQAASDIGVRSGEEYLKIMSRTPTMKEAVEARMTTRTPAITEKAVNSVVLDEAKIIKDLDNQLQNRKKEMDFLWNNRPAATKSTIRNFAYAPKDIREINSKAEVAVTKMKIGQLNVNQFKVGARVSRKKTIDAVLKNQIYEASRSKEAEALNIAFQKYSMKAIGEVNAFYKFLAKLDDPSTLKSLEKGGGLQAINELRDVFNLDPKYKGRSEQGAYQAWVKKMYESGNGEFDINPELADIRVSVNDLTVEQVRILHQRMKDIVSASRWVNRLSTQFATEQELQTKEALVAKISDHLKQNPDYNPDRIPPVQGNFTPWQRWERRFTNPESLFTTMEHVIRRADGGKLAGLMQDLIVAPLKGDGRFNQKTGVTKEAAMNLNLKTHLTSHIETYGKKDFYNLEGKVIEIPEFAQSTALNNGKLTKADLMVLWTYGGDPYTKARRAENMGVSEEVIQTVLDRELDLRDVKFMQEAVVEYFNNYKEDIAAIQKRTGNEDVDFVEGVPNKWRGQEFKGGYIPAKYRIDWTKKQVQRTLEDLTKQSATFFEKPNEYSGRTYALEQTKQGYLKERQGSDQPLDLSLLRTIRSHEEVIHDISYREVIRDTLALLRDKTVSADMISTVGFENYNVVVNTIVEMANRMEAENANYFSTQSRMIKTLLGQLQSRFAVAVLAFNPSSTLIQFSSISQLGQNMGVTGPKHIAWANGQILKNIRSYKEMVELAQQLDPTIGKFIENYIDDTTTALYELSPHKNKNKVIDWAKLASDRMTKAGMFTLSAADVQLKMVGAIAGYSQFINGDVEGYPPDVVAAMSPSERFEKAQAYVRQLSRLSLTHGRPEDKAIFQKNPAAKLFANFINDLRNVMNNQVNQVRKTRWRGTETYEQLRDGDYAGARQSAKMTAASALGIFVVGMVAQAINDRVRDDEESPINNLGQYNWNSVEGLKVASEDMLSWTMMSPLNQFVSTVPGVRDIAYGINRPGRPKPVVEVNIPITKMAGDIGTAARSIPDILDGDGLSAQEFKAWAYSFAYTILPIPVNGAFKAIKFYEDSIEPAGEEIANTADQAYNAIKNYLDKKPDLHPESIAGLEKIRDQIAPRTVTDMIPADAYERMKAAASGGEWNKVGPNGAVGIYQFTPERWEQIRQAAPELGLTPEGLSEKNGEEQEIAMRWQTENNSRIVLDSDVPLNTETLYAAHLFGAEKAVRLYETPGDQKVRGILDERDLALLGQFKTITQVRRALKTKVAPQLTSDAGG